VKLQGFRKEFENLKLKLNENESVKEFCIRLIELINQMRISDEEIHDRKIIDKVQMRKKKNLMLLLLLKKLRICLS